MANAFQDGVWILDTADTSKCLHVGPAPVYIKRLVWQPSAASQTLTIKDKDAEVKVSETSLAASPAGELTLDFGSSPLYMMGFILHTLTSGGTLYVYLDD